MWRPNRRWAVGLALFAPVAAGAETSESFQVSASVVNGCLVALDQGGLWGSIDFGSVPGTAQGTVEADLLSGGLAGLDIECTPGITVGVTADLGDNAAAGSRRVKLAGLVDAIPYQLFADGSAVPWNAQSVPISFAAGVSQRRFPVRARAQLSAPMRAGLYTDTVRVTLSW